MELVREGKAGVVVDTSSIDQAYPTIRNFLADANRESLRRMKLHSSIASTSMSTQLAARDIATLFGTRVLKTQFNNDEDRNDALQIARAREKYG